MAEETDTEDILDQHYLFFISFAKTYYPYIAEEKDRKLCDQWLTKLCGERVRGVTEKRNRNSFLAYFLMNLQEGKMTGPFSKPPDDGPLPQAQKIFGNVEEPEKASSREESTIDDGSEDYQERSADGRTYVAVRCLPNDQGTYAFVALSLDREDDDSKDVTVVPCSVNRSKLRHIRALHRLAKGSSLASNPSESQMEDFYMRNIETKVSGDVSQLYKTLSFNQGQACGKDTNEMAYYDILLGQIDDEIKGVVNEDNELVRFLVNRLAEDLKKIPRMKHLFRLTVEERNLRLLQILRQKLVLRQQEDQRRNLLAEMEETISSFGKREDCCISPQDATTESMWQLAITRPVVESDMRKMSDVYPENAISTFLDLLADDRSVILERGKKRQRKAIDGLRTEVYREVQSGKSDYNKARAEYREWNEILSIVEEMMYEAGNKVLEEDDESEEPRNNDALLASMIVNIKETKNLVIEEAQRAERLTEKIADANTWKYTIHDDEKDSSWEIKSAIERTRREIQSCELLIDKQNRRIEELREQLTYE